MLEREEARLSCVRGTPFGRLVVPEVWRKSATSDELFTISSTETVELVTVDDDEEEERAISEFSSLSVAVT